MDLSNVIVCSFYTDDSYYRGHAEALHKGLERLGLEHRLEEIEKQPGEEWPDICRKKIPFLAGVCDDNPDKKVFWIDVDCQLVGFPSMVADFSADMIGFQRGFGSPLAIGYANRTRFWEPCFFGINTTVGGRKFMADARDIEASSELRATDDYFFEESWRSNAHNLSFQVIPSTSVLSKAGDAADGVPVFFSFGASGKVAEFKGQVVQHDMLHTAGHGPTWRQRVRRGALKQAKALQDRLPYEAARRLRHVADATGATHLLTGAGADALQSGPGNTPTTGSPHRKRIVGQMVMAAQRGDVATMNDSFARLVTSGVPTTAEILAKEASDSFAHYASGNGDRPTIPLAWWPRPFPGNFGDWLSPLVVSSLGHHPVAYHSPTARSSDLHIVGAGSIGRFIKPSSIVLGTGVSNTDLILDKSADYVSVRGPITAQLVADSGGPTVERTGDPGILLSRIFPVADAETNGRLALVRHFTHANIPLILPEDMDELSVLMSHPDAIRRFVETLTTYDGVVTSAMHVMIACHSYGIPCVLVGFEGFERTVHGTGIKYRDYSLGAGLGTVHEPQVVPIDLRRAAVRARLTREQVSAEKMDDAQGAVETAVARYLERHA